MTIDRAARAACFLVATAVGAAFTLTVAGCGSGADSSTTTISPEAQKKTEDMLNNMRSEMQKKMQDQHKTAGKGARRGP